MIRRRTCAVGAALHLDNRSALLERLLHQTGTLGHLTARPGQEDEGPTHADTSDANAT
jgi:hypothetical protein